MRKEDLETPAIILDLDVLNQNLRMMRDYLKDKPLRLRPHTKCHKIPILAHLQLRAGAKGITVAKLGEAEVMANAGIDDIYIANQVVQRSKIERLVQFNRYSSISVAVDNVDNVKMLSDIALRKEVKVKVIEEIDTGLHRSGVLSGKPAVDLAKRISRLKGLILEGVMGYEGHSSWIKDFKKRKKECHECYRKTLETVKQIRKLGIEVNTIGTGGTTSYSIAAEYPGINEIQPGHYVIMSAAHLIEGVPFQPALTVLTTVVSRPARDRAIIDGGAKTFTNFLGMPTVKGITGVKMYEMHVEHGLLRISNPILKLRGGDLIEFIPAYSGTTLNLHDKVYVTKGDTVEDVWRIEGRGRVD